MNRFIVYDVYYCGFLAYVGSGMAGRHNHVVSGSSHNSCLNELYVRSSVFGEPSVSIEIYKYFNSKEESLLCEKRRIKTLKPLFNKSNVGSTGFEVLSKHERDSVRSSDIDLLYRIERLEYLADYVGVNPNLAFTPYGFRSNMELVKYDCSCFDIVSISTFGKCTSLDGYFDYSINHNDIVTIKATPETISRLGGIVGSHRFINYFDCCDNNREPLFYRDCYNPNYNGAAISEASYKYITGDIVLARRVNTCKGVDVVLCLRVKNDMYEVFCLNNNQIIYSTGDSSDALDAHRNTELRGNEFSTCIGGKVFMNKLISDGFFDLSL